MTQTHSPAAEVAVAITDTLLQAIDAFQNGDRPGIPVGDSGLHIEDAQHEEGDRCLGVLLSDGLAYEVSIRAVGHGHGRSPR